MYSIHYTDESGKSHFDYAISYLRAKAKAEKLEAAGFKVQAINFPVKN